MGFLDSLREQIANPTPEPGHSLIECGEWIMGDIDTHICPCGSRWDTGKGYSLPIGELDN